ncbi:MAG: RNA ligase [Candidatus Micrarchaeia archaeon]
MEIDEAIIRDAMQKGRLIAHSEEIDYSCFREKFRHVPRGTVIIGADGTAGAERTIPGFQRIKRIFTLEKGLAKNMASEFFWAEEKIDGFNLRVASIGGKLFAFSRGGFVDAFATEKVREMGLEPFFSKLPKYVLCGEMIGNTPYTKPTKKFDIKLFVFDIMDENGACVPQEKKYSLIRQFGLPSVPVFGKFSRMKKADMKKLKKAFLSVNKSGKEGIVMKSEDRKEIMKYVVPNADIEDIANSSHLLFDMPVGFINQRLLRSSLFMKDFKLDNKKYAFALGKAFYDELSRGLESIEKDGYVCDEYEILIKDMKIWDLHCNKTP